MSVWANPANDEANKNKRNSCRHGISSNDVVHFWPCHSDRTSSAVGFSPSPSDIVFGKVVCDPSAILFRAEVLCLLRGMHKFFDQRGLVDTEILLQEADDGRFGGGDLASNLERVFEGATVQALID